MKYRVWLPEQERLIEADSEDEAQDIFQSGDDIFDFLEVEPVEDAPQSPAGATEAPGSMGGGSNSGKLGDGHWWGGNPHSTEPPGHFPDEDGE